MCVCVDSVPLEGGGVSAPVGPSEGGRRLLRQIRRRQQTGNRRLQQCVRRGVLPLVSVIAQVVSSYQMVIDCVHVLVPTGEGS